MMSYKTRTDGKSETVTIRLLAQGSGKKNRQGSQGWRTAGGVPSPRQWKPNWSGGRNKLTDCRYVFVAVFCFRGASAEPSITGLRLGVRTETCALASSPSSSGLQGATLDQVLERR